MGVRSIVFTLEYSAVQAVVSSDVDMMAGPGPGQLTPATTDHQSDGPSQSAAESGWTLRERGGFSVLSIRQWFAGEIYKEGKLSREAQNIYFKEANICLVDY